MRIFLRRLSNGDYSKYTIDTKEKSTISKGTVTEKLDRLASFYLPNNDPNDEALVSKFEIEDDKYHHSSSNSSGEITMWGDLNELENFNIDEL